MNMASRRRRLLVRRLILSSPFIVISFAVIAGVGTSFAKMSQEVDLDNTWRDMVIASWNVSADSPDEELNFIAGEEQAYNFNVFNGSRIASRYRIEVDGSNLPDGYSMLVSLDSTGITKTLSKNNNVVFDENEIGITLSFNEEHDHRLYFAVPQDAGFLEDIDIDVNAVFTQIRPGESLEP